jgi:hypothetical protein
MNREQTVVCHFSTTDGTSNLSHTATLKLAYFLNFFCNKILNKFVPIRAARKIYVLLGQDTQEQCFTENPSNLSVGCWTAARKIRPSVSCTQIFLRQDLYNQDQLKVVII